VNPGRAPLDWFAGLAGGALLFAWAMLMLIFAGPAWANWATGVSGALLTGWYLWTERAMLRRLVLSPALRSGSNSIVFSLAVVGAVALVNVIATRHSFRSDLTANKFFSLSDQTTKMLKGLNRKVKITVFEKQGSPEAGQIEALLKDYRHVTTQLEIEFVDTDQKPAKALLYKITSVPTAVFESGSKRKDVLPQELFGYQFNGQQPQREFKGESVMTASILSVASDTQQTVCFLEGHGERSVNDTTENGVAELKAGLERDNYIVKTVNLVQGGKITPDTSVLIIAGPRTTLPEQERAAIAAYLAAGGKLLALLDITSAAGLDRLLAPYGVECPPGMAVDPRRNYEYGGPMIPVPEFRSHKITDDLMHQGINVMLPGTRALKAGTFSGGTVSPLLETTPESWLESDWKSGKPHYDKGVDKSGPLTLGLAVSVNTPPPAPSATMAEPATPAGPQPKLVVYGDVEWVTNKFRQVWEPNLDLIGNSVSWLTGATENISIRPKQNDERHVFLDNVKTSLLWWITIVFTPLGILGAGVWRWWRRRSL